MLSMLAVIFLAVLSLIDVCRRQVLGALANRVETILGGSLLASVISTPQGGLCVGRCHRRPADVVGPDAPFDVRVKLDEADVQRLSA